MRLRAISKLIPQLKNNFLKFSMEAFQPKVLTKEVYNTLDFDLSYKVFSPPNFPKVWFDGYKSDLQTRKHNDRDLNGDEPPPVILLHGLTNAKETWDDCGQEIANRTGSKVYAIDARNHGDSGWIERIDYNILPEDITCFMDTMGIPSATIVGHSMGGKQGMIFGLRHPHRLHSLIIEDISYNNPQYVDTYVSDYIVLLREALRRIPIGTNLAKAKKMAATFLSTGEPIVENTGYNRIQPKVWNGNDLPLRLNSSGQYEWKTNLKVIEDAINRGIFTPASLPKEDERDLNRRYDGPVLMLYGTHSPLHVLSDKEMFLKQFPNAVYEPIEGATHSIHVEYPEQFTEKLCNFILKNRQVKSSI